ncbi:unnamed protein product [Protopolystoma xenopodis]|uniref:Uncharacterized protein n=1 Tax=Protopolystoma xenopodis TaxID=117903 RepID=A0A448WAG2_9PLAT|nr:unnamed protein product [Protopolystoma xenopodis]
MISTSDDVYHMKDDRAARLNWKRRRAHGLRQLERRIKAKRQQYNGINPSSSSEIDLRISSSWTFISNEIPPNNKNNYIIGILGEEG